MSMVKGHMSNVSFVFFGTPELSVEILECLKKHGLVPSIVVTNPDRPQGRNMVLTPPPVKLWALKNGISFLQPESLGDPAFLSQLSKVNCQLFLVVAYGKIIPKSILAIPSKGTLNIHYSLLPRYRGASPIESAILNDDKDTGVSIMLMDEKMDHGPIVVQENLQPTTNNPPERTVSVRAGLQLIWPMRASELRAEMNKIAGELLVKTIPVFIAGEVKPKEQEHTKATYAGKFTKNDGLIDLTADLYPNEAEQRGRAYKNFLKIRAFDDSIGTHFFAHKQGKKIRIVIKDAEFRDGKLIITRVLPEGKKEVSYEEFSRGLK